jgi:DNA-binding CsgD family transcriptional regulator
LKEVQQMFSFVDEIVCIPAHEKDFLEVFIFDQFYSCHPLMQQLNGSQKELIAQHLSRVALEVGEKDFRSSVHTTYDRLIRYKNLNVPLSKDAMRSLIEDLQTEQETTQADDAIEEKAAQLSPAQKKIYEQLLLGASSKIIAERVGVSEATVNTHIQHIFQKFKVDSRLELFALILSHFRTYKKPSHSRGSRSIVNLQA